MKSLVSEGQAIKNGQLSPFLAFLPSLYQKFPNFFILRLLPGKVIMNCMELSTHLDDFFKILIFQLFYQFFYQSVLLFFVTVFFLLLIF